jgi:two-component system chemotaxis response regulator CheB
MPEGTRYEAVVIGASAGGLHALSTVLAGLPGIFSSAIAIVQHLDASSDGYLAEHFNRRSAIPVKEAEDKESVRGGTAYVAPAGYHLLIERDRSFSLSVDEKVSFVRPAIDVLFESAADAYGAGLIGVVLTGSNCDGAEGLRMIKRRGGLAIVQDPVAAEARAMPQAALAAVRCDHVVGLDGVAPLLADLCQGEGHGARRYC